MRDDDLPVALLDEALSDTSIELFEQRIVEAAHVQ
jgi:hypothetical protein